MISTNQNKESLTSYTVNVDTNQLLSKVFNKTSLDGGKYHNPLLANVFNTPNIINPLNGTVVNAVNNPYSPYLTVNSNITPLNNPIPYPISYPPIIRTEIDDDGNKLYPPLPAFVPRPVYNPMINVNNDPNLRNQMSAYFYEELIYWLAKNDRYQKLLSYLSVKSGSVVNEFDKDNRPEHKELKLKYIVETFDKYDIAELLDKFCIDNRVNWWDLKKDGVRGPLKNYIYSKIKSYLKKKLSRH